MSQLSVRQQRMVETWEAHTRCEFTTRCVADTMATMTDNPSVLHVPVMTGAFGRQQVEQFYGAYFVPCQPADTEVVLLSRTVSDDTIVDELIHKFTHTIEMPWILPGVPPTGRKVDLPVVAVIKFVGDKIASERIYWDQASVLTQVGLLDPSGLPVLANQAARRLQGETLSTNELIRRDAH